jgi:hypothetical protein
VAASPCGNHLAQVWQVGEGVSPTLDATTSLHIFSWKSNAKKAECQFGKFNQNPSPFSGSLATALAAAS